MDGHNRQQPGDPWTKSNLIASVVVASTVLLAVTGVVIWAIVKIVNHFT